MKSGWGASLVFGQTVLLVVLAVWSLGGRMEGALLWIGGLAWCAPLFLLLDPQGRARFRAAYSSSLGWCGFAWAVLILILLFAPFNAQNRVEVDAAGRVVLEPLAYYPFLPSALVVERCREYGLLLSGLMVQAMVLWLCFDSRRQIRRLLACLAANAILAAVVGAAFRLAGSEKILGLAEPVHSGFFASFRYHNHWTGFALLAMGQCLALALYWYFRCRRDVDARRRRPDLLWLAGLLILSVTLPMTTARAGVLFLVLFWLVLGARLCWGLWSGSGRGRSGRAKWWVRGLAVALPLLVAGLLAYSLSMSRAGLETEWKQSLKQVEQFKSGEYREIDWARTDSWGDGWRMLRDRPVWGWGFGSHRYLYQIYARDEYRHPSGVVRHIKEFAHNDWMQYLPELGVVGFVLLLTPPVVLLVCCRRGLRCSPLAQAVLFPGGLVLLLATFEFPLSNPAVLVVFFVQVTLGLKLAEGGEAEVGGQRSES